MITPQQAAIAEKIPVFIKVVFLFVIFLTCRWKVVQKEVLLNAAKSPQPLLLCLWHEQLVYVSRFFKNSSSSDVDFLFKIIFLCGYLPNFLIGTE